MTEREKANQDSQCLRLKLGFRDLLVFHSNTTNHFRYSQEQNHFGKERVRHDTMIDTLTTEMWSMKHACT